MSRLSRLGKGRAPSVANATLFALLAVYAAAVVLWLLVGLVPALADASPSFETTLRSWGYGQDRFAALARNAIAAVADVRHGAQVAVQYAFSLVNLALAIFLMWRRPRDTTARLLAVAMLGTAAAFNLQAHSTRAIATPVFSWVDAWHDLFHVLSGVAYVYAVLLFPDGKLVPRLPRWAQIVLYGVGTFFVANVSLGGTTSVATHPDFFVGFFGLLIPVVGVLAQRYRYRRASSVESRQQARLLLWALVPAFCVGAVSVIAGARSDPGGDHLPVGRREQLARRRIGWVDEEVGELRAARHDPLEGRPGRGRDAIQLAVRPPASEVEVGVRDGMTGDAVPVEDRLHVAREPGYRRAVAGSHEHRRDDEHGAGARERGDHRAAVRKREILHCSSTAMKTQRPGSGFGMVARQRPGALSTECSSTVTPASGLTASV